MKIMTTSMPNNMDILSLWETMAKEHTNGMIKRLLPLDVPIRIFGIYTSPQDVYGIAVSYSKDIKVSVDSFKNLKELNIKSVPDSTYETNNLLIIQLMSNVNLGVFTCLCVNLINVIMGTKTEQDAVRVIINQIECWQALFDKVTIGSISPSEQQGLYGELVYLGKLINHQALSKVDSLRVWVGVDKATRDFQGAGWAVEVKTSSTNNAGTITINGKRQLDEMLLDDLFLFHLSLEVSRMNGETLNDKVDEIRSLLSDDAIALNNFNAKLFKAGYIDSQRFLYKDRCYKVRAEHLYHIDKEFPRIKERELRNGIVDVVYTIDVSICDEYLLSENEHFKVIQGRVS